MLVVRNIASYAALSIGALTLASLPVFLLLGFTRVLSLYDSFRPVAGVMLVVALGTIFLGGAAILHADPSLKRWPALTGILLAGCAAAVWVVLLLLSLLLWQWVEREFRF